MLKNKTREQIKSKFNLKSTLFNTVVREIVYKQKEDDLYNEEKTVKYNKSVFIDIPNYLELPIFKISKPFLICLFQIVMEGIEPFILYLLHKTDESILDMPVFNRNINKHNLSLKQEAVEYMNDILMPVQSQENGEVSYAGFMETDVNNILFLKYVSLIETNTIKLPTNYYWATVHELVNLKTVFNIPIETKVTQFLINNRTLLKLKNENEVVYEIPVVGYYIVNDKLNSFDIYREKKIDKYEKCYYFHINVENKSVIRCALFLKKTGLINDDFSKCNSIVYNKKNCTSYYLIKDYAQHTILI